MLGYHLGGESFTLKSKIPLRPRRNTHTEELKSSTRSWNSSMRWKKTGSNWAENECPKHYSSVTRTVRLQT